jgi:long-chain acyl-CoA synthetase
MEERIVRSESWDPKAAQRAGVASGAQEILDELSRQGPVQTIPALFFWRARQRPDAEALRYKAAGRWRSITFRTWEETVRSLAAGLAPWVRPGDRVAVLSENRPEWTYADLATLCLGGVVAPIYPTDPPKDIAYVLKDSGAATLFVSDATQLAKIETLRRDGAVPGLERVIVFDPVEAAGEHVLPFEKVLELGRKADPRVVDERVSALDPAGLVTLVYTSGTTGERKGVMLTHENIVGNVDNTVRAIGAEQFHDAVMLSFLPLSHMLERMAGYYSGLRVGAITVYAESIEKLPENLVEARPTILISVPRVYEKVYGRIQASAASPLKRTILRWATAVGVEHAMATNQGRAPSTWLAIRYRLADRLVFSKFRERLGGRLRIVVTGGAPLSKDIAIFLRAAGLLVIEGYGLTETSPVLTLSGPERMRFGSVGRPIFGVELKIAAEPGYDRPGEGEILARGSNVMLGYYHKDKETAEVMEPGGWFHTGDVGYFDPDGYLYITDRKKELLKTSGGKYVAPAPIEGRLNLHPLIEQSCVIGNRRKYCVVLLVPKFEALAARLGRPLPADRTKLGEDPEVRALFQEAIDRANRDLGSWEQMKHFALLPQELSQATGELTPTQKMKRRVIDEKYQALIDTLYPED